MELDEEIQRLIALGTEGDYWDYIFGGTCKGKAIPNDPLPVVAITTTAGTGTEADPWTVITNGNVALAPVFDSEKSFKNYAYQEIVLYNEQYNDPFKIKFSADEESSKLKTYSQITAFLNKCNDEEQAYFKDLYEKYSPLFIETFLKDVDDTIKTPIIRDYTTHYQNLGVILSKEKGLNHE